MKAILREPWCECRLIQLLTLGAFPWTRRQVVAAVSAVLISVHCSYATAANGAVVYTYDALGRIGTASYDTGVIIIYAYDANGNRTAQIINVNSSTGTWGSFNWGAARW